MVTPNPERRRAVTCAVPPNPSRQIVLPASSPADVAIPLPVSHGTVHPGDVPQGTQDQSERKLSDGRSVSTGNIHNVDPALTSEFQIDVVKSDAQARKDAERARATQSRLVEDLHTDHSGVGRTDHGIQLLRLPGNRRFVLDEREAVVQQQLAPPSAQFPRHRTVLTITVSTRSHWCRRLVHSAASLDSAGIPHVAVDLK